MFWVMPFFERKCYGINGMAKNMGLIEETLPDNKR